MYEKVFWKRISKGIPINPRFQGNTYSISEKLLFASKFYFDAGVFEWKTKKPKEIQKAKFWFVENYFYCYNLLSFSRNTLRKPFAQINYWMRLSILLAKRVFERACQLLFTWFILTERTSQISFFYFLV